MRDKFRFFCDNCIDNRKMYKIKKYVSSSNFITADVMAIKSKSSVMQRLLELLYRK